MNYELKLTIFSRCITSWFQDDCALAEGNLIDYNDNPLVHGTSKANKKLHKCEAEK